MNPPKTADGATICYGDVVYYMDYRYESHRLPEPFIRTLTVTKENMNLHNGTWYLKRKESASPLFPSNVYRNRRRLVTMARNYWKDRIKELKAKLKVWDGVQTEQT